MAGIKPRALPAPSRRSTGSCTTSRRARPSGSLASPTASSSCGARAGEEKASEPSPPARPAWSAALPALRRAPALGRRALEARDGGCVRRRRASARPGVDDSFDAGCLEWARRRGGPTLLVRTEPAVGLTRPPTWTACWPGRSGSRRPCDRAHNTRPQSPCGLRDRAEPAETHRMDSGTWLCPTPFDRERLVDVESRLARARTAMFGCLASRSLPVSRGSAGEIPLPLGWTSLFLPARAPLDGGGVPIRACDRRDRRQRAAHDRGRHRGHRRSPQPGAADAAVAVVTLPAR